MLSMKPKGKMVDFNHIAEKFGRDLKIFEREKIKSIIDDLVKRGFIQIKNGLYGASEKGREFFKKELKKVEKDLEKINKCWLLIYKSKQYYPVVKDTILKFCKDRYVGFYCVFTQKRFFRRDFKGRKIVIRNWKDLEFFVNMHCIDIIPCVHRIGSEKPDWLVIDIDPGSKIDFSETKEIAKFAYKLMEKLDLNPVIKFSGSRGFQIWSSIEDFEIPKWYRPLQLKSQRKREISYFSLFSDFVRVIQKEIDKKFPGLTSSSPLQKDESKILIDPSSMKRLGLVRSPYSIHSKSGLVSLPISYKEIERFKFDDACIEKALERYNKKGNEFELKSSSPSKLLEILKNYMGLNLWKTI